MADVKPPANPVGIPEARYRCGVSQALNVACDMVVTGATGDDLALMRDWSMEMRYDERQHMVYLNELEEQYFQAEERFLFVNQESE